jgi:16S rRNA (cytosine967-C5)-methyltransferase
MHELAPEWTRDEMADPALFPRLVEWLQRRPPLWLRAQTSDPAVVLAELRELGLEPEPHPALESALKLTHARINLLVHAIYREGRVEVQDLASQAIGRVCAPRPGERWWDACAGGGGKTLLLAQLMEGKGRVLGTDVHTGRLENLRHRVRRAGFQNVATHEWDGGAPRTGRVPFDGVLVDVPCTGSGTWRRNPHARWSLSRERIGAMADQQLRLLSNAARGVKPGGTLVYSTCSFFRPENDGVVAAFLADHADFMLDPFAHPLTGAPTGGLTMVWPWDGDCDAMFVARFLRAVPHPADASTNG